MSWNFYDTELENELRQERNTAEDRLYRASKTIVELRRQLCAQSCYIEELEKQLEPNVVAEIRAELSHERTN